MQNATRVQTEMGVVSGCGNGKTEPVGTLGRDYAVAWYGVRVPCLTFVKQYCASECADEEVELGMKRDDTSGGERREK